MHEETLNRRQYDASAKKLLSYRPILARIIKHCVMEFRDVPVDVIAAECLDEPAVGVEQVDRPPLVETLSNEDTAEGEGKTVYDVRVNARVPDSEDPIDVIINLEAQKSENRSLYPIVKRGLYYCSRLISSQRGTRFTGMDYGHICKVYSIWVLMNVPKKQRNSIVEYSITEEVHRGDYRSDRSDYDLMSLKIIALGERENAQDEVLGMLDTAFSSKLKDRDMADILKKDYGIDLTPDMKKETDTMCNLSEGFYDRGVEEGLATGRREERKESARRMLKNGKLSISEIAEYSGLSLKEVQKLAAGNYIQN